MTSSVADELLAVLCETRCWSCYYKIGDSPWPTQPPFEHPCKECKRARELVNECRLLGIERVVIPIKDGKAMKALREANFKEQPSEVH